MADSIVQQWLQELGLGGYIGIFRDQGIDVHALAELSDAHFIELGIVRVGDRAKLMGRLAKVKPFRSDEFQSICHSDLMLAFDVTKSDGWHDN